MRVSSRSSPRTLWYPGTLVLWYPGTLIPLYPGALVPVLCALHLRDVDVLEYVLVWIYYLLRTLWYVGTLIRWYPGTLVPVLCAIPGTFKGCFSVLSFYFDYELSKSLYGHRYLVC